MSTYTDPNNPPPNAGRGGYNSSPRSHFPHPRAPRLSPDRHLPSGRRSPLSGSPRSSPRSTSPTSILNLPHTISPLSSHHNSPRSRSPATPEFATARLAHPHEHAAFAGRGGYHAAPGLALEHRGAHGLPRLEGGHPGFGGRGGYNAGLGVEGLEHRHSIAGLEHRGSVSSQHGFLPREHEHEGFGGRGGYNASVGLAGPERRHSEGMFGPKHRGSISVLPGGGLECGHEHPGFGGRGGYNSSR